MKAGSVKNWLVVISQDNWEICRNRGLLGMGNDGQFRLGRMSEGDLVWVYVNKLYVDHETPRVRQIQAVAQVAGPVQFLTSPPWRARGPQQFPYARAIDVVATLSLDAYSLFERMPFARRRGGGGVSHQLMNAPVALDDADVAVLRAAVAAGVKTGSPTGQTKASAKPARQR
jgi:hypothetical protein